MEPLYVLKWHEIMGIRDVISEEPYNAFKACAEKKKKVANVPQIEAEKSTIVPIKNPVAAALEARQLAEKSHTLAELKAVVTQFRGLSITKTATNTVFGDGNPDADIMFIGEAPGADEDRQGIPFCGQSGQLLTQIFAHTGLTREKHYYITNSLFWRPPGNRKPTTEELAVCKPFVEKHIALVNPKLIVLVGATAVSALLDKTLSITKIRGQFLTYANPYLMKPISVVPIFHPSYLLRAPGQKRYAWQDALTVKEWMRTH